jgi:hypothetical protein
MTSTIERINGFNEMSRNPEDYSTEELREIVDNLIAGMSLARVAKEIHSRLLVPLSAAKNEAIVAGQAGSVKRIQAIMRELHLNPRKPPSSAHSSQRPSGPTFVTTRQIEHEATDINQIIDELIAGRDMDTVQDDQIWPLITGLKARKQDLIASGDYRSLRTIEELLTRANSRRFALERNDTQNSKTETLKSQLTQAKEILQTAEEQWTTAKDRHDEDYESNLRALEDQQTQQLQDFENSFPEVLPLNFRKLSNQVLQLRKMEKHLVLSKRYDEAADIRERADELEENELEVQREKFSQAFKLQRQQLLEVHAHQKDCFDRNWKRKKERFERERDQELSALKKSVKNIEMKVGEKGRSGARSSVSMGGRGRKY